MRNITAIIFVALLVMITGCTQREQSVLLKYKYQPNSSLNYVQDAKTTYFIHSDDSTITNEHKSYHVDITYSFNRHVNDSTIELLEISDWAIPEINKEDSTKIDTVVTHREMSFQLLENGKIVDFDFISGKKGRKSYLKNYFEQGMPVFPDKAVSPGYNWTQSIKVVLPNETMDASTTYRVKSIVRESGYDCAIIDYEGNLLIPVEPMADDPDQRSGIDRISNQGQIYFAYKEGFVVKQTEKWHSSGDRVKLKDGKMVEYKIESDYDVEFILVDTEGL